MKKLTLLKDEDFLEEEHSIYGEEFRESLVDNDELDPWEAAWMQGYEDSDAM